MAVTCAKCGEELMGAVNRCWRCGQEFEAVTEAGNLPPVRRRPVAIGSADVFIATLSDDTPPSSPANDQTAKQTYDGETPKRVRKGSPFADRGSAVLESADVLTSNVNTEADDLQPNYAKNGGAKACAALAIPLGLISLIPAFWFPIAGVLIAAIGVALSIWGLFSNRRGFATVGLILCCLSLAAGSFNMMIAVYVDYYGRLPWESAPTAF